MSKTPSKSIPIVQFRNNQPLQPKKSPKTVTELSGSYKNYQLDDLRLIKSSELPRVHQEKDLKKRIFVNRDLNMANIEYYGYDMDYTLAEYTTEYEDFTYKMIIDRLIDSGYPEEIKDLKYDPGFSMRGLFLDKKTGHLCKIDEFGYILKAVFGKKKLTSKEIRLIYPDRIINVQDEIGRRFWTYTSLFGLPEACLYCDLVDFFQKQQINISNIDDAVEDEEEPPTPITSDDSQINVSYWGLFDDVRECTHMLHVDNSLKKKTVENLPKFIKKNPELPIFLDRLRKHGKKVFILTNSPYDYTQKVMSYLLDDTMKGYNDWKDFFHIIITNAQKPRFFQQGSILREVDEETGHLKFTKAPNCFKEGVVYSGGSFSLFKRLTKTTGSEVIYCGDNIFSDLIVTKKKKCLWRTLLVVKELRDELDKWCSPTAASNYNMLQNLKYLRQRAYLGISPDADPDSFKDKDKSLRKKMRQCAANLDDHFNPYFGSLFRTGIQQSHFGFQASRYSDLYCADFLNLSCYPTFYYFTSGQQGNPVHEIEAQVETECWICKDGEKKKHIGLY